MAQDGTFGNAAATSDDIAVRRIRAEDLWHALKEGVEDFNAKPTIVPFLCVIYPALALILTLLLVGENLLHLAFPMVAGFTLLGPVASIALYEMSRRRAAGLPVSWRTSFEFVHSASFAPILALSLAMVILYLAWLYLAEMIYLGLFGAAPPDSLAGFVTQVITTRAGAALIFYGTLVGFMFAVVALSVSVVAFPLLLDRRVSVMTAVSASIKAVSANSFLMVVWGLIVVALLIAGSVLLFVGLAAVLPILGHSTWHLYRKLVEPG